MNNIIMLVDSYKMSQYNQYPPGTKYVYLYTEARVGTVPHCVFKSYIEEANVRVY